MSEEYRKELQDFMAVKIKLYVDWCRSIGMLNHEIRKEIQKILDANDL